MKRSYNTSLTQQKTNPVNRSSCKVISNTTPVVRRDTKEAEYCGTFGKTTILLCGEGLVVERQFGSSVPPFATALDGNTAAVSLDISGR